MLRIHQSFILMRGFLLRARTSGILLLTLFFIAAVSVVVTINPVLATSCSSSLGSLVTGDYFKYNSIAIIVPVTAQCSFTGGSLYANGVAYQEPAHTYLANATALMVSAPGSSRYYGQLVFTQPMSEQWKEVQVTVTIVNAQSGSGIVTTSEAGAVDPNTKYVNEVGCMNNGGCNAAVSYCYSANMDNNMQCVGYIDQNQNGCVELVVPDYSPYGFLDYQYLTLQNLPASYPPVGTWATVTGQLHIGHNTAINGAACPGNYLNVTAITP